MLLRKCHSAFSGDLPLGIKIPLGPNNDLVYVLGSIIVDLAHPPLDIFEGAAIDDGKCEDDAGGPLVVGLGDVLELLLACGVPDLQLELLIVDLDGFDFEVNADGGDVGLLEVVLAEAHDEVGLADAAVANDDDLGHVVVVDVFLCFFHFELLSIYYHSNTGNSLAYNNYPYTSFPFKPEREGLFIKGHSNEKVRKNEISK